MKKLAILAAVALTPVFAFAATTTVLQHNDNGSMSVTKNHDNNIAVSQDDQGNTTLHIQGNNGGNASSDATSNDTSDQTNGDATSDDASGDASGHASGHGTGGMNNNAAYGGNRGGSMSGHDSANGADQDQQS